MESGRLADNERVRPRWRDLLRGRLFVKVDVAHVVNGQIARTGDPVSLLGGDENASFTSLLDLGGSETGGTPRVDASGKQRNRSKEKESDEKQSPALGKPGSDIKSNLLGLQILPSIGGVPWQFESGDFAAAGAARDELSLRSAAETTNRELTLHMRPAASVRTVDASGSNRQQILDENGAKTIPIPELKDPKLIEPSKGATGNNQGAVVTKAVVSPKDQEIASAIAQSSSSTLEVAQLPAGSIDNDVSAPYPQAEADSGLVGTSAAQGHVAASSHRVKSDGERQDFEIASGQPGVLPEENGRGQVALSVPPQGVVDTASSSSAGRHGQGSGNDTHRNSSDAKGTPANDQPPTLQGPVSGALGALDLGGSEHGHSAPTNPTHLQSARESTPDSQLKQLSSERVADPNAPRLLASAMHGDLRVGVHTEAFGRVTIQTSAQGGQLSAQLSLENAKEGATLAAHLPAVEQKIVQQHGLNASVRLVGGFDGGTGGGSMGRDQSGAGRRDPDRYRNDVLMRSGGFEHESSNEGRGVETALLGSKYLGLSRLDVTV